MDIKHAEDLIVETYTKDEGGRDRFIENMEVAWSGLWLNLGHEARPGVAALQAAWDWAYAADPRGAMLWLQRARLA